MCVAVALPGCGGGDGNEDALVVYVAHDQVFSEQVLKAFTAETGIPVKARYDTEATKSLGLTELIKQEASNPRCDVFWNNLLLGTAELADEGLLEPYEGPSWQRVPARFKDPQGRYVGFAGRLRVWIVNTDRVPDPTPEQIVERMAASDLSRVAMAKPIFGTTLSHMTVWWNRWGGDATRERFADWRQRGLIVQGGNGTVMNLVAQGTCDFGLTDTDDYFVAVDADKPVTMLVYQLPEAEGAAILIPNTAAIVKGTQRRKWAERLVDYLASEEVELRLAKSQARQLPLGPTDPTRLPPEVAEMMPHVETAVPLTDLVSDRAATLEWLKTEHRD